MIDAEKPLKSRKFDEGFFERYNELEEINLFLEEIAETHATASLFSIGFTYEGRSINGMKISTNENNAAIFIEANIHAREWISSATATWVINEILTNTDPEIRQIVDSITWYIIPVANPDGKKLKTN